MKFCLGKRDAYQDALSRHTHNAGNSILDNLGLRVRAIYSAQHDHVVIGKGLHGHSCPQAARTKAAALFA